jgi:hypothetical protein
MYNWIRAIKTYEPIARIIDQNRAWRKVIGVIAKPDCDLTGLACVIVRQLDRLVVLELNGVILGFENVQLQLYHAATR